MSGNKKLPGPVRRIFDQIDALSAEDACLFWQIVLYGTTNQKTGAVSRPGLMQSAVIEGLIKCERTAAESWARRAERYANLYAALNDAARAYVKRRNRRRSQHTIRQDRQIAEMRDSGRSWKQVANQFGIRVRSATRAYRRHKNREPESE